MIMISLLASILFAFFVAWLLVKPHVEVLGPGIQGNSETILSLNDQKARCVQVIKDLDLDFSTGKLSKEDYERMRKSLTMELAGILTRIDQTKSV